MSCGTNRIITCTYVAKFGLFVPFSAHSNFLPYAQLNVLCVRFILLDFSQLFNRLPERVMVHAPQFNTVLLLLLFVLSVTGSDCGRYSSHTH